MLFAGLQIPTRPGPPDNSIGMDNAWYLDIGSGNFFGPKLNSVWPSAPAANFNRSPNSVAIYAQSGTTDQTPQLTAAVAAWNAITATTFGNHNPALTAQPLVFPSGVWTATNLTISTSGTGAAITGEGVTSQLFGISINVQDFENDIKGLNLIGPGYGTVGSVAINYAGNDRRFSLLQDTFISQYETGLDYNYSGGSDNAVNVIITYCGTGLRVDNTFGTQFANIDMLAIVNIGFDLRKIGEVKLSNCRVVGCYLPFWIHGTSLTSAIESYYNGQTATNANNRVLTILSAQDNGSGYAQLTLATKISCTIGNLGNIFVGGSAYTAAAARISFSSSNSVLQLTTGSVLQIVVHDTTGDKLLLPSAIPFTTNFSVTQANVGASINAGTATHGYTATVIGGVIYLNAPLSQGASANGRGFTVTTSGQVTDASASYISLNYTSPHGFNGPSYSPAGRLTQPLEDAWFDPGTGYTSSYFGQHAVVCVLSSTVIAAESPYGGSPITGNAWVIPRIYPGQPYAFVSYLSGGVLQTANVQISAAGDTTIDTNWPTASFPTLPAGSTFNIPGWDIVIQAEDTGNTHVQDHFFTGGNGNAFLVKSGMNINFFGMRTKDRVWIDFRASKAFRATRVNFHRPGKGRNSDPNAPDIFTSVPIGGTNTGWLDWSDQDDVGLDIPGNGYGVLRAPNNNNWLTNWQPQYNDIRVSEDDVRLTTAGQTLIFNTTQMVIPVGLESGTAFVIQDQTAISFTPPVTNGTIMVGNKAGQNSDFAIIQFATTTPRCSSNSLGANMNVSTSVLTGTTGTSGKITVSAVNGLIYIENRTGGQQTMHYCLFNV